MFLVAIFIISLHTSCGYDGLDDEIVGDIFGQSQAPKTLQGISSDLCIQAGGGGVCSNNGNCVFGKCVCNPGWTGQFCSIKEWSNAAKLEPNCEKYRACVEGSVFGQYWKHFASAYECYEKCSQYTFVNSESDPDAVCTAQYEPVCGLDKKTYGNSCEAVAHGIPVHCKGQCPCPPSETVCEFHKNLDGDSICPPYRYILKGTEVHVYRPPCLADDIEVNVGVWNGETAVKDGDHYPHGWGLLTYLPEDHLNRREYSGNMKLGMREGHGTLYWKDGSYYAGQWVGDIKDGEGTLFYASGDIYSGHWAKEKKTGEGKYMYSKGGEYSGGFDSGKKSGPGSNYVMRPDDQWELYTGQYVKGARSTGAFNTSAGFQYSGEFSSSSGNYNGTGTYVWACGKKYTGTFVSGFPSGYGTLTYPQGWTYAGNFCSGKFQGYGKFTWSEHHYYEGEFLNGEMTGAGVYALQNGGLFDNSVGLYYPDRNNKSEFQEAHFDGKTLRVKKLSAQQKTNSGYGK